MSLQACLDQCLEELHEAEDELIAIFQLEISKRWLNREFWIHPMNQGRMHGEGFFNNEFQQLKLYPQKFKRYVRMDLNSFEYLLAMVEPLIAPMTNRLTDICAEQRLAMTLRFLATGDQIDSLAGIYKVGESTLYEIILKTCIAIHTALSGIYLQFPPTAIWYNISKGFSDRWNLPNCLGPIDGKHIHINAPPHSGSHFFNYKKNYSIVLMAACDYKYQFTWVDIGAFGGESDGGILSRTDFGEAMEENTLPVPSEDVQIPGSNVKLPYFYIGDDAFKLRRNFLKPYPDKNLTRQQKIFNYRISRARNCIECAFGILVRRWRVLKGRIGIHPNVVDHIVSACVCLHNFIINRNTTMNEDDLSELDEENDDAKDTQTKTNVFPDENIEEETMEARNVRDALAAYFMTAEGEVPWQYEYVDRGKHRDHE